MAAPGNGHHGICRSLKIQMKTTPTKPVVAEYIHPPIGGTTNGRAITLSDLDRLPAECVTGESEDSLMGRQLTVQWERVKASRKEDLIFGAMMVKLRERISSARGGDHPGGPRSKGTGVEGWLKKYAPTVSESIAYRLMEIAEGIALEFKLGKKLDLEDLLSAQVEGLSESLLKKRAAIEEVIEGRSQRQLLLQFGGPAKMTGGKRESKKTTLTPEEQQQAWEASAKKDFLSLANGVAGIKHVWMASSITDAERELLADHIEALAAEIRGWVSLPKSRRTKADLASVYVSSAEVKI